MRILCCRRGIVGIALVIVGIVSTSAAAEPITAIYDVNIVQRYDYNTESYESFSQQFSLRLTFDPAAATEGSSYGAPTFSHVPLTTVEPPPGAQLTTSRWTNHHAELDPDAADGTYRQYAIAGMVTGAPDDRFYRVLTLESFVVGLASRPTVSAATFPIHLGMNGGQANLLNGYGNFLFAAYRRTGDDFSSRVGSAYWGDALLRQVESPVPEPGTCLLVTGGLAVLARRRHRDRSARIAKRLSSPITASSPTRP